MLTHLKGLVSFVTGGGSGLGLAVCRRLAAQGSRVVTLDLRPSCETIENVLSVKGLNQRESLDLTADLISGDIRNEEDIRSALSLCVDHSGDARLGRPPPPPPPPRLDALVNCAGVANAFKIFNFESGRAQRLEDFAELIDINVCGTFNAIRLSVDLMARSPLTSSGN